MDGREIFRAFHLCSLGRWGGQRTSPEFDLKEEVAPSSLSPTTSCSSLDLQHSALVTTSWSGAGWMEEQEQRPATELEKKHEMEDNQKRKLKTCQRSAFRGDAGVSGGVDHVQVARAGEQVPLPAQQVNLPKFLSAWIFFSSELPQERSFWYFSSTSPRSFSTDAAGQSSTCKRALFPAIHTVCHDL